MEPDFSGYATKAGLKCSDGRTITAQAFAHQDGEKVPLVWSHDHKDPTQVLGYAILHSRGDGVWTDAYFNDTDKGQHAKKIVQHGDVVSLSIFANELQERARQVLHGMIREVSLVLAGANPGALIENTSIRHGDGTYDTYEDEARIFTGEPIVYKTTPALSHADTATEPRSIQAVYDDMTDEQKDALDQIVEASLVAAGVSPEALDDVEHADNKDGVEGQPVVTDEAGEVVAVEGQPVQNQSAAPQTTPATPVEGEPAGDATTDGAPADDNKGEDNLAHSQEGTGMTVTNVFEQNGTLGVKDAKGTTLTHSEILDLLTKAKASGSIKDTFIAHAADYGIEDINLLFPDAKNVTNTPQMIARRMEWVTKVIDGTKHSPFAKVKTLLADITADEARARGYVKGTKKVDEVIQLLGRTTSPGTVYKKQRLDRDDILDITSFDVVNWLWAEINVMILEELARAILVGDNRAVNSPDKIKDPAGAIDGAGIRSILHDDELFAIHKELAANVAPKDAVKGIIRAMGKYRGSGRPTMFVDPAYLTEMLLEEDKLGRALYANRQELADKFGVESIVTVELFNEYTNLLAIIVNLDDYTIGTNAGGELTKFDQFDLNFNQYHYLLETRLSGGLTKPFSAIVVLRAQGTLAVAEAPSYNGTTHTITVPTTTGVVYTVNDEPVSGDVVIDRTTTVEAEPDNGYYLETGSSRDWTFNF